MTEEKQARLNRRTTFYKCSFEDDVRAEYV